MSNHPSTQKLNTLKSFQLMSWAQKPEVFARLSEDRDEDIAGDAAKDLGFNITTSNIKGIRQALGISKRRAPVPGAASTAQIEDDLQELAKYVIGMAQQLGMSIPARVNDILSR